MESDLIYFLLTLPVESKYRLPGANRLLGGCTDRIMTFDPQRGHGSSAGHFFSYLNRILRNRFLSLEARAQLNPAARRGTLRLAANSDTSPDAEAGDEISEERLSASCIQKFSSPFCDPSQHGMVAKFVEFVEVHNRELLPVLTSLVSCRKHAEARADLGLDDRSFSRARLRLKVLHIGFATGQAIPRQRRIYRSRKTQPVLTPG